ncbi:MAG: MBL fold metallo-hydrolase [Desulfocucumaceae bacterium]
MQIKWFGTASILFKEDAHTVLFDPYLPLNKRLYQPSLEEFATPDNIVITHGHFDHLIDVPLVLSRGKATVYCSDTAAQTLMREGVESQRIIVIAPGDDIEMGPFNIHVLRGKHIVFDRFMVAKTLLNPRVLVHFSKLRKTLKDSSMYPEGQTLAFHIQIGDYGVLHLGSLNMDETEVYPTNTDLLTIPFQGRSDLNSYGLQFVQRIRPRSIYLHHFDDSFPPISSSVDVREFTRKVKELFPETKVIVPKHGQLITL